MRARGTLNARTNNPSTMPSVRQVPRASGLYNLNKVASHSYGELDAGSGATAATVVPTHFPSIHQLRRYGACIAARLQS